LGNTASGCANKSKNMIEKSDGHKIKKKLQVYDMHGIEKVNSKIFVTII